MLLGIPVIYKPGVMRNMKKQREIAACERLLSPSAIRVATSNPEGMGRISRFFSGANREGLVLDFPVEP
jgi:hypothetical protein